MARYLPVCDGVLSSAGAGQIRCSGGSGWISVDATYLPGQFNISMLDASLCSEYFAVGFISVGGVLLVAKAASLVLGAFRVV